MTDTIAVIAIVTTVLLTLFGCVIWLAWYFYQDSMNKAAELLGEKLDTIVEKLDVLFSKDNERKKDFRELSEKVSWLAQDLNAQKQHCNDTACKGD